MTKKKSKYKYTVCELFAGVGGFRLGLEGKKKEHPWRVIWSNQWEPGKKEQHASNCYINHFGEDAHSNEDIAIAKKDVPSHDLLVGGFPCQDYSVATTKAHGITGKKGVLWWEINSIIKGHRPPFILLENVDRLVRSPADQRGMDFGIILSCLNMLGYTVEWRVVNAADYGFPQRRRRTFIFATKEKKMIELLYDHKLDPMRIIESNGFFAREFPVQQDNESDNPEHQIFKIDIPKNLVHLSNSFKCDFFNAGLMINGKAYTKKVVPKQEKQKTLGSILQNNVDTKFYINKKDIEKWIYFKGAKDEPRKTKEGFEYRYKEGGIPFPDNLETPSRTMLTAEGNKSPNRITHVIKDKKGYRVLTPEEAEKLNGFPAGWTKGIPERWQYFCMGNALVVGLIERMGKNLINILNTKTK